MLNFILFFYIESYVAQDDLELSMLPMMTLWSLPYCLRTDWWVMVCQLPHGDEHCGNKNVNNFLLSMSGESRMSSTVPCLAFKTASPVRTGVQGTSLGLNGSWITPVSPECGGAEVVAALLPWIFWNIVKHIHNPVGSGTMKAQPQLCSRPSPLFPPWLLTPFSTQHHWG